MANEKAITRLSRPDETPTRLSYCRNPVAAPTLLRLSRVNAAAAEDPFGFQMFQKKPTHISTAT